MIRQLLMEGPVGHMWHPFDLDSVQNGKDLLEFFIGKDGNPGLPEQYINKFTPSIKIDGINGPIRLVVNNSGEKEFAIDRMSRASIDVEGVTADRLKERFEKAVLQALDTDEVLEIPLHKLVAMGIPMDKLNTGTNLTIIHRKKKKPVIVKRITSGHGFVNDGTVALTVLNNALNSKPQEMEAVLRVLDMWNNPNVCLNNDIVHESSKPDGQVGSVKYGEDFIAFHGLNEIYSPEGKTTRKTREIRINDQQKAALNELVKIINETNTVEGFRALSPFDTVAMKGEVDIDYTEVLGTIIEIKLDSQTSTSQALSAWLNDTNIEKPSYSTRYTFSDGKVRSSFSKANYIALIPDQGEQQYSIRELLSEEAHPDLDDDIYYDFASGAIFYHATRLLGRAVLQTLINKSKVGNEALTSHEGIVMRSKDLFGVDKPIKITGDFIRDGMGSNLALAMQRQPEAVNESTELQDTVEGELGDEPEEQTVVTTTGTRTVAVMPGSFKPPHRGHLLMAEHLSNTVDKVLIFVSDPKSSKRLLPFSKDLEISYEKALELWDVLLKGASNNIELVKSSNPSHSPIMALAELMKPADEREYYQDYEFYPEEYAKFYLAMSEKEQGDKNSMRRFSYYEQFDNVEVTFVPAFQHDPSYKKDLSDLFSGSQDLIERISQDIELAAEQFARKLVRGKDKLAKLPGNASVEDYLKVLSKTAQAKVAKFLKSRSPSELKAEEFSATDLRLLLDLKMIYKLPVDKLLIDFVGQNLDQYIRIIYPNQRSNMISESTDIVQNLIRSFIAEQLEETATMASGAVHMGGSKPEPNRDDDEEDDVKEAKYHPSELPIQNPRGSSYMTVRVVPSGKYDGTDGNVSDAGFKKHVKNRFKIDSTYTDKRAPYYDEDDIITDLVEKVLHNIIRLN